MHELTRYVGWDQSCLWNSQYMSVMYMSIMANSASHDYGSFQISFVLQLAVSLHVWKFPICHAALGICLALCLYGNFLSDAGYLIICMYGNVLLAICQALHVWKCPILFSEISALTVLSAQYGNFLSGSLHVHVFVYGYMPAICMLSFACMEISYMPLFLSANLLWKFQLWLPKLALCMYGNFLSELFACAWKSYAGFVC